MKKITIIALFAALGMVSCKDKKTEPTATTETTTTTTETAPVDPHAGHNHAPGEGHGAATTTATPSGDTKTAAGMNPPHGQPNHRCDIAVGAPLNSPPGQGAQQQAAPTSAQPSQGGFLGGNAQTQAPAQQAAPQQQMPPQQTAPGMKGKPNPAHGQPGHRCDVSVGQPLP